jgi:copper(I)-binding protein
MRMRPVPRLHGGGGQTVEMKPGGERIMLLGLRPALKGESPRPTLTCDKAGAMRLEAAVP